jgi:hypothetical protein
VVGDVITWGTECTGGPSGQLTTDANGFYQTQLLPVGSYSVGAGSCPDVTSPVPVRGSDRHWLQQ